MVTVYINGKQDHTVTANPFWTGWDRNADAFRVALLILDPFQFES